MVIRCKEFINFASQKMLMRNLYLFLLFHFCSLLLYGKKELQFFVDYCRFQNTEGKPYIEIYISLDPKSLVFKKNNNNFINQTQVLIAVYPANDLEKIILADKFVLSTEVKDTTLGEFYYLGPKKIFPSF